MFYSKCQWLDGGHEFNDPRAKPDGRWTPFMDDVVKSVDKKDLLS